MEMLYETDDLKSESPKASSTDFNISDNYQFTPIGYIKSIFKNKNGTPRQSGICNKMAAKLEIDPKLFNNPEHSIDGLNNFSHVWLLFVFHLNNNKYTKAKVRPPRLNGKSQGIFATRSPYRFNPIGLTLAQITKIEGHVLYLSGIDIVDGTPIIDIKPYIEEYDYPKIHKLPSAVAGNEIDNDGTEAVTILDVENLNVSDDVDLLIAIESKEESKPCHENESLEIKEASWIKNANTKLLLNVRFTPTAETQCSMLNRFQVDMKNQTDGNCENFLNNVESFKESICQILSADPRSSYRRNKCQDRLYFLTIDFVKLTCWFDEDTNTVEVLRVSDEDKN